MEFEKLKQIIVNEVPRVDPAKITPEARFVDDLGADSLDSVELIMAVEEETGLSIPEETATKLTTVGSVIDYLTDNL